jgi:hypothetical protein
MLEDEEAGMVVVVVVVVVGRKAGLVKYRGL